MCMRPPYRQWLTFEIGFLSNWLSLPQIKSGVEFSDEIAFLRESETL